MSTEMPPQAPSPKKWTRSYPPLVLIVLAVIVAAFILPSSLNLPQSNPSTVLEYAPVPPEDDEPPPPSDGNASALGLGSSSSLTTPIATPPPPPPPPDSGGAEQQRDKSCVGDRQTHDPLAPPCVAFFDGDNFGATYQGVTRNEIVVLMYFDRGNYIATGQGAGEPAPSVGYIDASEPSKPPCPQDGQRKDASQCDHVLVRNTKALARYFNASFQTYKRKVHFWVYFTEANTAALRKKDAADNWSRLKPFAVIDGATFNGFNQEYQSAMAARGVLTFTQETALPASHFQRNNGLSWGFWPDVEHWAENYSSYVCQKLVTEPVKYYGRPRGQPAPGGSARRFGLWYTSDTAFPGIRAFAALAAQKIRACGANVVAEGSFAHNGYTINARDTGQDAADAAIKFQQERVSTVLYLGGVESNLTKQMNALSYYPEIVVAGDLNNDSNAAGREQDKNSWQNAWAVTYHVRLPAPQETLGCQAYRQGYPDGPAERDCRYARDMYTDFFMLFTAIQVAGPRLNPGTVDKGFHAIPEKASTNPFQGAFFFDPGDYTAIKDSALEWWDFDGTSPGSTSPQGCWRMVQDGTRYLAGMWDQVGEPFQTEDDACTGYGGGTRYRLA